MKKINVGSKLQLNKSLIGQLDRNSMSRIKGGYEEEEEIGEEDDGTEGDYNFAGGRKRTRSICGTSRSARVCISLSPCNGCS